MRQPSHIPQSANPRWLRTARALALCLLIPSCLGAGEIVQHFPAQEAESNALTQWRIVWGVREYGGQSEVLYIKEAHFKRSRNEPEIQVLGDSSLAEIFVPYQDGLRIYDISIYNFSLAELTSDALGPACIKLGQIFDRSGDAVEAGPVAVELHDDDVRWVDMTDRSRRGQVLVIWSVLQAGNYRYIMQYRFRDDGVIGFRLGATASNLESSDSEIYTHLHCGWWRFEPVLGDGERLKVSKVHIETVPSPRTVTSPVDLEQGFAWRADQFTKLRIESETQYNGHEPPHPISYELAPHVAGTGRYEGEGEVFTQNDFWVTRALDGEFWPKDLPGYANGESLDRQKLAIWHQSATLHAPRDEDFGKVGTNRDDGLAITAWTGFDLKPRNFFSKTPLYEVKQEIQSKGKP